MQTYYKKHRIATERKNSIVQFDIYFGAQYTAAGFVIDEFSEQSAIDHSKNLIDRGFETAVLTEIRKISRGA